MKKVCINKGTLNFYYDIINTFTKYSVSCDIIIGENHSVWNKQMGIYESIGDAIHVLLSFDKNNEDEWEICHLPIINGHNGDNSRREEIIKILKDIIIIEELSKEIVE